MDRALTFVSQNGLNQAGSFSRGQPHHFQLKHTPDWGQGSGLHKLVTENRPVMEK